MVANVHVSAGVYTKEVDLSQRLSQVQSTIAGIVGASNKGPVGVPTLVTSVTEFVNIFGEPDARVGYMHYCAIQYLQQASRLWVVRMINEEKQDALTAGAVLSVDDIAATNPNLSMNVFDDGTLATAPLGKFDPTKYFGFMPADTNALCAFWAVNPGTWNSRIHVQVKPVVKRGTDIIDNPYDFVVEVYLDYVGPQQSPVEKFIVNRDPDSIDGFSKSKFIETVINRNSSYIRCRNNEHVAPIKVLMNTTSFLDGGSNGTRVRNADIKNGWELFRDAEKLDVNILINGGYATPDVHQRMDDIARSRMDCIAILDMPSDMQKVADAVDYRRNTLNIDSSYSAIYSSDCLITDTYNDMELYVPPSGLVAAAYAYTDRTTALWFAPAGVKRGKLKIKGLKVKYDLGQRDALEDAQINSIRFMHNMGYNIWGATTLQSMPSSLSNVNVRRLCCFVEKTIAVGVLYAVFDPNDEFLRRGLVEICTRFLEPIKRGRGLYNYDAVCDESNNFPETIANGDLILDVYLDPTIPAKRIQLTAVIVKTGVSFKEVASARANPNG